MPAREKQAKEVTAATHSCRSQKLYPKFLGLEEESNDYLNRQTPLIARISATCTTGI
jgi:hypothetical protein